MVVAVPIPITITGQGYCSFKATHIHTMSEPTAPGLSRRMSRPVLMPGPTTKLSTFATVKIAFPSRSVTMGTTLEIIEPLISFTSTLFILNIV